MKKLLESLAIATAAALGVHTLKTVGLLPLPTPTFGWVHALLAGLFDFHFTNPPWLNLVARFFWSIVVGVPVFLISIRGSSKPSSRMSVVLTGYMWFRQLTLSWDRNSFCRGWLITGSTGSGKTECGINVLLHQVFRHENGTVKASWQGSDLQREMDNYLARYRKETEQPQAEIRALYEENKSLAGEIDTLQQTALLRELKGEEVSAAQQIELLQRKITDNEVAAAKIDTEKIEPLRAALADKVKRSMDYKYDTMPWGGLCIDEKGMYWQILSAMASHYGRDHNLMLLQTRPEWAGKDWKPKARFNLLSDDRLPANTYADAICRTAKTVQGGGESNPFFTTQAGIQIGWAIKLDRALRDAMKAGGCPAGELVRPSLKRCSEMLASKIYFDKEIQRLGFYDLGVPDAKGVQPVSRVKAPRYPWTPELEEAITHFEDKYWKQPKDQLGGVQSTIANYLNYFTQEDVAEVFCSDNTFEISEVDYGMILCVAMPQKLQIERRYVCTILKLLFYQHILRRFDVFGRRQDNLLVCWQDEAQRFVTEADGNVDVIRQASGTTVMACQFKSGLYNPLGGREKAVPIINNLRNRMIFTAADKDCAEGSADLIGKKKRQKKTKSDSGKGSIFGGGYSYSYTEEVAYKVEPTEITDLPKFTAYVYHADGKYRKMFIPPVTTKGTLPPWIGEAMRLQGRGTEWLATLARIRLSRG